MRSCPASRALSCRLSCTPHIGFEATGDIGAGSTVGTAGAERTVGSERTGGSAGSAGTESTGGSGRTESGFGGDRLSMTFLVTFHAGGCGGGVGTLALFLAPRGSGGDGGQGGGVTPRSEARNSNSGLLGMILSIKGLGAGTDGILMMVHGDGACVGDAGDGDGVCVGDAGDSDDVDGVCVADSLSFTSISSICMGTAPRLFCMLGGDGMRAGMKGAIY